MFEKIKEDTKSIHVSLEKVLMKKLNQISNVSDYVNIMSIFYIFHQSVEGQILKYVDPEMMPDLQERRKLYKLKADIETLGHSVPVKPAEVIEIKSLSQALGVLYVIEGSTLGGKIIAGMISQKYPELSQHCEYFKSYGAQTPEMWARFKENVLRNASQINESEMIDGAQGAFGALYQLFETVQEI